jgi:hypothetical protein
MTSGRRAANSYVARMTSGGRTAHMMPAGSGGRFAARMSAACGAGCGCAAVAGGAASVRADAAGGSVPREQLVVQAAAITATKVNRIVCRMDILRYYHRRRRLWQVAEKTSNLN